MKTSKIAPKMTVETQAAWICRNCNNQIMAMGNLIEEPKSCGNCTSTDIKKLWAQKITTLTTVEHL